MPKKLYKNVQTTMNFWYIEQPSLPPPKKKKKILWGQLRKEKSTSGISQDSLKLLWDATGYMPWRPFCGKMWKLAFFLHFKIGKNTCLNNFDSGLCNLNQSFVDFRPQEKATYWIKKTPKTFICFYRLKVLLWISIYFLKPSWASLVGEKCGY